MKQRAAEIHASLKHPVIDGDGHWLEPVPVFLECLHEVGGAQLKGFVTEQDFREFTFTNGVMLHTRNNPDFFKSTVVEQAVADEVGRRTPSPAANM